MQAQIQDLKYTLLSINGSVGIQSGTVNHDTMYLVDAASQVLTDFTGDIASKTLKYRNLSEKQAYCLARAIIEFGGPESVLEAAKEAHF